MDPYNQMSVLSTFFPSFQSIRRPEILNREPYAPRAYASLIPTTPSLPQNIGYLRKDQHFSVFNPEHMEEAAVVYNFLLSLPSFDDIGKISKQLHKKLNDDLFYHAYSIAVHYRPKAKVTLPALWEFKPRCVFTQLQIKQALETDLKPKLYVTGTVHDPEFQLAWWREDHQLNAHHLHWHQVYPSAGIANETKDRQGELFYYMHQQMLARYDAERLAVGLPRVEPFSNWNLPIQEGYNSHLTDHYGYKQFTPRPAGVRLGGHSLLPGQPSVVSQQYHLYKLLDAINHGYFEKKLEHVKKGQRKGPELVEVDINLLGAAIESSIDSPNKDIYGSLHNMGHMMIAAAVDPDGRYKLDIGVMGDEQSAIRDPIFFRWHRFIDDLFFKHKIKLPSYTKEELACEGVCISSIKVKVDKQVDESKVLYTYSEKKDIDITMSMIKRAEDDTDVRAPEEPFLVTVQQLNHTEFSYSIEYKNKTKVDIEAVFRIFMAPTKDEYGKTLLLKEQRRLFIEMDKFVETLKPGTNKINPRSSKNSSVTILPPLPVQKILEMAQEACTPQSRTEPKDIDPIVAYCECGWPHHLLLPRGKVGSGMAFDLFVMVTDWKADSVSGKLDRGTSYCGLSSAKYPDKRAMGFPFDRPFQEGCVDDLVKKYPNMKKEEIQIQHDESEHQSDSVDGI